MEFSTSWQGKVLVGTLKGEMGFRDHAAMSKALDEISQADASAVVLNFADVVYLASMGIGLLMKLVKDGRERGIAVRLAAVRPAVKKILAIVGAEMVLPMDASVEESMERVVAVAV